MYPDELRPHEELFELKVKYALRNPEETYHELISLRKKLRQSQADADGRANADVKRRLNSAFKELEKERRTVKSLTSELDETKALLQSLRNSKTMKAGEIISAPYNTIKRTLAKRTIRK